MIVVQAAAARRVLDLGPEQAREALLLWSAPAGRRWPISVTCWGCSGGRWPPTLDPQPGIEHLETLVRRVSDAGLPVEAAHRRATAPPPPASASPAYRIVQEALTNALKHAGPARRGSS